MSRTSGLLAAGMIALLIACGWLLMDNRALRQELAAAQESALAGGAREPAPAAPAAAESARTRTMPRLPAPLRAAPSSPTERPALRDPEPAETRAERRMRRQGELAAMFGRLPDESEDEYRARMVPFLSLSLTVPRQRMGDARRAAEEAAGVTDEQRASLDAVFEDVYQEAIDLTNRALATGELTPYARNVAGALNLAGGMGAILESAEGRIQDILSPEQSRILYEQGFEWAEYLGANAPWETLNPPPPPSER